ncbi:restriction endonuclease subunit S [Spongiibacter tropicus]|uniref:restriction endonuclease subunit S n=1 Tax=Spongiibacter tropicus TaxID=454602 RepID=UPI0035BE8336
MSDSCQTYTVDELVKAKIIEKPLDGNHGAIHPKGNDFVEEGIPFVMASDLIGGTVDTIGCKFISSEQAESLRKGFAKPGDVLLSHKATIGRTAIVPKVHTDYVMLTPQVTYYRVRDKERLNNLYLKYYFDSPEFQNLFSQWAGGGSTRAYLGITGQLKLPIVVPSIDDQQFIAHILGTLDDKIELNRQINTTLESMAQALFKSWFVDFDPVIDNALAAGNDIPGALQAKAAKRKTLGDKRAGQHVWTSDEDARRASATEGASHKRKPLPDGLQQQFPDRFVFTEEMGWVPEGWDVLPVSDAIFINPKVSLKKGTLAPFVDMKALPTSGYSVDEISEKAFSGGAKFEVGDVLLARITPCLENGKTAVVDFLGSGQAAFGSTEFIVLRPKGEISTPFVASLARDANFRQHCITNMVGSSGRQRVQNSCFDSYFLALPTEGPVLQFFTRNTEPWFLKMTQAREEIKALSKLRDTLLPKLLSGELRIPEAEKQLAEVL